MITKEQLDSAVLAGVLDQSTADALTAHAQQQNQLENIVDEEYFRLITGFNDIFVVIASLLLFVALSWIGGVLFGGFLTAIAAWGLAEFFVLKRCMALPAIMLLVSFVGGVFYSTSALLIGSNKHLFEGDNWLAVIGASIIAIIAAWLHWRRFRVPITVAAGASLLVLAFIGMILTFTQNELLLMPLATLAGVAVFILAMWWDASDTKRETRKSDVAFWLHLTAAPLIIHPVFSLLGVLDGKVNLLEAGVVFMLYLAIAVVSLLIDRRALMVSSLGYVIYVFSDLLSSSSGSAGFAMTALVIGSALLLLSVFWHKCRVQVLKFAPVGLRQCLPA